MTDGEQQHQNGQPDDGSRRFIIRLAWGHVAFFFVIALVATFFRGLRPEVLFGWIVLVYLCTLMLLVAYGVRKVFLGVAAFVLAAMFYGATFFHEEGWSVATIQLQDWAIGAAAFAVGVLAYDAKKRRTIPYVTDAAGVLAGLSLLTYGVIVGESDLSFAGSPKGIISLVVIMGLYGLTDKRWRNVLAIAALLPMTMLLIKTYEAGLFNN
jgi:hypothetical protein